MNVKRSFLLAFGLIASAGFPSAWAEDSPILAPVKGAKYRFEEKKGEYIDLLLGDQMLIRYVNKPRDGTTKDTHELTFKPFHHVFDPVDGKVLLTNGPGLASDKANLYPH